MSITRISSLYQEYGAFLKMVMISVNENSIKLSLGEHWAGNCFILNFQIFFFFFFCGGIMFNSLPFYYLLTSLQFYKYQPPKRNE